MKAVISPCRPTGTAEAPPSKSMAHRMLICAGLAGGTSLIRRVDLSEDIRATMACLGAFGAELSREGDAVRVTGHDPRDPVYAGSGEALFCRESGSTLRFMIPLCLLSGAPAVLCGSEKLLSRPLSVYETLCRERGIRFGRTEHSLRVEGRLAPGAYTVPGDVSSQFVSGLLFALPFLDGGSVIRLVPPVESRPYIDMTVACLRDFGAHVRWEDGLTLSVAGNASLMPRCASVEGDFSNAAFFEAMNLAGGDVRVTGLPAESAQGDRVYRAYFEKLRGGPAVLDVADCPDLAPVLFTAAALCHGGVFTGTARLRYKESDRAAVMAEELAKCGIRLRIGENSVEVLPGEPHAPWEPLNGHNDHRVVMALSVLCLRTGGEIDGAEAVKKSFPDYWNRLKGLGAEVEFHGMD